MDLHLHIDDDQAGLIDIDLQAPDTAASAACLDCRRVSYEEIGGEAVNATRYRSRHQVERDALDTLRRLLPTRPLTSRSDATRGSDGTAFTLTIGRGAGAIEYAWWSRPPAEWTSLGEIVRVLVALAGIGADLDLARDDYRDAPPFSAEEA